MVAFSQSGNGSKPGEPSSDRAPDSESAGARSDAGPGPPDPGAPLVAHLAELREYLAYYVVARLDAWKLKASTAVGYGIVGCVGAVACVAMLSTAAVFVLSGLAAGIGILCGGQLWIGQLIVGSVLILVTILGLWFFVSRELGKQGTRLIEKYERRKQNERTAFGTDVARRAEAPIDL